MNIKVRVGMLLIFIMAVFAVIAVRLFYIQVIQHGEYSRRARRFYTVVEQHVTHSRGRILDRNGIVLAENRHTYSVGINPVRTGVSPELLAVLSNSLGRSRTEMRSLIMSGTGFRWIVRHAEPADIEPLYAFREEGIVLVRENHRIYPQAPLASDIIGIVGTDNQGLGGVEHSFENYLRGIPQKRTMIRDARGRSVSLDIEESSSSRDNAEIYLTLDAGLQYIAEREIKKGLERVRASGAMVVIQEPGSGKILAMASYPAYDNSMGIPENSDILKIKPVTNIFEPGSTFKIFTAAGALQEGLVEVDEQFDCEGGTYTVGGFPIRDFEPHDFLSFREVMRYSSNIGIAKTAERMGENLLYKYARNFGFGNFTGIRLPGEPRGILRKPDRWSGTSLSRISFGQEVGVTAVQLACAISSVANGGILREPQIVEKISISGNVRKYESLAIRRVISEDTARNINDMLVDTVRYGSGVSASVRGYPVAGKTGTAQKFDPETFNYAKDKYIALFGGYIPADDPKLTIVVIFEEPEGPFRWGSYVAAPVFSNIARAAVSYLDIKPSIPSELALR